jgi:hypothetical protein
VNTAWHEIRAACPYCECTVRVFATDIRGELRALRCAECKRPYVVEVSVVVAHAVHGLEGQPRSEAAGDWRPPTQSCAKAACGEPAAPGSNYCVEHAPVKGRLKRAPRVRAVQGSRY